MCTKNCIGMKDKPALAGFKIELKSISSPDFRFTDKNI
jgi:hypothetical protein